MWSQKLVIATNNPGKLLEFQKLLGPLGVQVFSILDFTGIGEIKEDGNNFQENALIKARLLSAKTGLISLGDDSGLEVDYLNGQPGIYSARFAGASANDQQNNQKLLHLLGDLPAEKRTARFKCALAIVAPNHQQWILEGVCEGLILKEAHGSKGFGYDPLFYLPQYQKTFAQLDAGLKNKISHRGRAIQKAYPVLEKLFSSS